MVIETLENVKIEFTGKLRQWGEAFGGEPYLESDYLAQHKTTPLAKELLSGGYKIGDDINLAITISQKR